MARITANDLKTRGIAAIEACLAEGHTEAVVSVHGAERYVVMDIAHYHHLRECELEAALAESRADIAAGRFVAESPAQHVARLQTIIGGEASAAAPGPRATPASMSRPLSRQGTGTSRRGASRKPR